MSNLHQMSCGASGAGHGASEDQDENARKRKRREICKISRKRIKQDKDMFKGAAGKLNDEIAELEKEIRILDEEGSTLSGKLENLETRKTELTGQIGEKEKEVADQNEQLNQLSTSLQIQPVISIYDLETHRKEFEVLTQITTWDDWESEKSELESEILELRMENSKLQTEYAALVQVIVQDREHGNPAGY